MKEDDDYQMMLEANFLKHIGYEHVNAINEQLDQDNEDSIMFPVALDKWFEDYYHKDKMLNSKRYDQNQKHDTKMHFKRVAVVLFFVLGVNLLIITNVEAFRLSIFDALVNVTTKFTQVDFVRSDQQKVEGDTVDLDVYSMDWKGEYYPTIVPTGYEISSMNIQDTVQIVIFTNNENEYIVFFQSTLQLGQQINTENGIVEKITINDNEVLYMSNDTFSYMTVKLPGCYIMVEATDLTKEEMILIIENIKPKHK